jgi:beta-mannanase
MQKLLVEYVIWQKYSYLQNVLLAANHVLGQLAQVANQLTFYQMAFVHHAPKIVKAVTFGMTVRYVSRKRMVCSKDVLSTVM